MEAVMKVFWPNACAPVLAEHTVGLFLVGTFGGLC